GLGCGQLLSNPRVDVMSEYSLHLTALSFLEDITRAERKGRREHDCGGRVKRIAKIALLTQPVDPEVIRREQRDRQHHPASKLKYVNEKSNKRRQQQHRELDGDLRLKPDVSILEDGADRVTLDPVAVVLAVEHAVGPELRTVGRTVPKGNRLAINISGVDELRPDDHDMVCDQPW